MIIPDRDTITATGKILVVDDEPLNRSLLRTQLEQDKYEVREAGDGEEAWEVTLEFQPDVILLDIVMPGVGGIETCAKLRSDERTKHLPVILVTAQREREDRIAGISAGASDFVTKPVDVVDLRLRVKNWLNTKKLYDRVQAEYRRVAELEQMRDSLVHMVVHDLRTPVTCIMCNLELAAIDADSNMSPEWQQSVDSCITAAGIINDLVNSMLDVSRLETNKINLKRETTDLHAIVTDALRVLGKQAEKVTVRPHALASDTMVSCDSEILRRVVVNLLNNAASYSPEEEPVALTIDRSNGSARVSISDKGPGIPEEFRTRIFEKFFQADTGSRIRKASTGLGLTFCKLAVEAHAGSIGVISEVGYGSTFWFEIPATDPLQSRS